MNDDNEKCVHGEDPDLCDRCSDAELEHCLQYDHDTIRLIWQQYHQIYKIVNPK